MTADAAVAPPVPPVDRRRFAWAAVPAALVVLALAGVMVNRSISGEPFSTRSGMSRFPGTPVDDPFGDDEVVEVAYQHDADYSFDFTLTNQSRWPVRILGFPKFDSILTHVALDVDTTPFDGPTPEFVAFRPFTLGQGGSAVIRVRTRFANCGDFGPGTFATVTAVPVRSRALWATSTRFVELPTDIQVPAPADESCPAR